MRKFRHDISIIPPKDVRFSGKSLSEYELILALIEKVNELIKYTNSVAELVYALEKWINDEFINAIDESTKKTLIEWRESGYLQELVEDYLVNLTVATSELLDEDEQNFKSGWHPVLDTKLSIDKAPEEVFDENYAQNELINGDFRNAVSEWQLGGLEYEEQDGILLKRNDLSISNSRILQRISPSKKDSVYYTFVKYINLNENANHRLIFRDWNTGGSYLRYITLNDETNKESVESGYFEVDKDFAGETNIYIQTSAGINEEVMILKELFVVNLTELFGKGNEPSKEWCDKNLKYYPNWQDLSDEEKPYTIMTLEKGVSDDLYLISKIQESNLQKHDSMVRLRNAGQPFIIKDGVSGKYVEVPKSKPLDPNVDGVPFNEYNLRNVFANITFSLHPDNTDDKIMVALDKSSIMHKVNLDEGFLWLISRMDKLEDDMVIFEQWVREFVTTKITELENKVNKQIDDTIEYVDEEILKNKNYVDSELVKNKNYVDQEVNETKDYVNGELPKKLDVDVFERKVYQPLWSLEMRYENRSNNTSNSSEPYYYSSPQGACIVGKNIVIAHIVHVGKPTDDKGVLREYELSTGKLIRESGVLPIYHANGIDYNPKTNKIYVAHANQVGDVIHNNNVSVINYSTFKHEGEVSPNIPSGRRVKSYTYDKITGKQYVSDDKGVFEVDSNFRVVKTIDFDKKFIEHNDWGLGQNAAVHDNKIYFLTMGHPTVAVFDIKGKLDIIHWLPIHTEEGYFMGEEPQAIAFDKDGYAYLSNRWGLITSGNTLIGYVFKTHFKYSQTLRTRPFTRNIRTAKTLYVDPKSNYFRPDGTSGRPFKYIEEALYFAVRKNENYQINLRLHEGVHLPAEINLSGQALTISGTSETRDNVIVNGLRISGGTVSLNYFTVLKHINYDYCVRLSNGIYNIVGLRIDGENKGVTGLNILSGCHVTIENNFGNRIRNCNRGVYITASTLIASSAAISGAGTNNTDVHKTGTGFAPLID